MRYVRIDADVVQEVGNFTVDPNGVLFHADFVWIPSDTANLDDVYDPTSKTFRTPTPPVVIDTNGFIQACNAALGGPTGIMALPAQLQAAVSFTLSAVQIGDWADVQVYITAMEATLGTEYAAIKAAAAQFNIPVTLP